MAQRIPDPSEVSVVEVDAFELMAKTPEEKRKAAECDRCGSTNERTEILANRINVYCADCGRCKRAG